MQLLLIPPTHIDRAWKEGAQNLGIALKYAEKEVTPDQLKLLLAKGEWQLFGLEIDGQIKAWVVVQFQQLPNIRVLYVHAIYAPGSTGPDCFNELASVARNQGCSAIRGACVDQVARLWKRRFGAEILYSIIEIQI